MKILKLRFKNLNSLTGEWEIDFEDKRFTEDGLFAIVGATGAGKSTILDAISLSLYARTPRLNKITKSENEIMSKGEGECFSEVLFEVNGKKYRTFWYQHRSRKKSDGDLQNPRHEVYNEKGDILEDKLRDVPDAVEKICGLDFDKMRRSMLLAQGGFDIFLKADANERAPLLEEITGTKIYSEISSKVYEQTKDIKIERELLRKSVGSIELLEPNREKELKESLKLNQKKYDALQVSIERLSKIKNSFSSLKSFRESLNRYNLNLKNIEDKIEEFKPKNSLIGKIKDALQVEHIYLDLQRDIKDRQEIDKLLIVKNREFIGVKKELDELKSSKDNLEKILTDKKELYIKRKPILQKTIELDIDINHKIKELKEKRVQLQTVEGSIRKLDEKIDNNLHLLEKNEDTLKQKREQKELNKNYETLKEDTPLIKSWIERETDTKIALKEINIKIDNLNKTRDEDIKNLKSIESSLKDLNIKKREKNSLLDKETKRVKELDFGGDISKIKSQRDEINREKERVNELLLTVNRGQEVKDSIENIDEALNRLSSDKLPLEKDIYNIESKLKLLLDNQRVLRDNLALAQKVQNLQAYRDSLNSGEPCPLCGSTEHPLIEGDIPKIDKTKSELDSLESKIQSLQNSKSLLEEQKAKVEAEINVNSNSLKELKIKLTNLRAEFKIKAKEYNLSSNIDALKEKLENFEKEESMLNSSFNTVIKIKELQDKLKKELEALEDLINKNERDKIALESNINSSKKDIENSTLERDKLSKEVLELKDMLRKKASEYKIDQNSDILIQLKSKVNFYDELIEDIRKLDLSNTKLSSSIEEAKNSKIEKQKELKEIEKEYKFKSSILLKLQDERFKFLENGDPKREIEEFEQKIEKLEEELSKKEEKYTKVKSDFDKLDTIIKSKEIELEKLKKEIDKKDKIFNDKLKQNTFSKEEFLDIINKKNMLESLEKEANELREKEQNIISLIKETDMNIAKLEDELKGLNGEDIELELSRATSQKEELLREIGAISQELKTNKKAKERHKSTLEEIELIDKELTKWERLNELIGSSDGKKFRNFAQGLTFEIMINHANKILEKMSDRYYLLRDKSNPLELNIVDLYQAGEVRSVKNLSGGESFIVSLSLALGLSSMVSKKVKVDSLFLDEGFGTLDEESMETALSTLSTLQAEGKLIGVISHIQTIKERIYNQISLNHNSNGKSTISGVGVRRV